MIIKLEDDELRVALAEVMAKKIDYSEEIDPEECWWEVEAGVVNEDGSVEDINNVHFCYKTQGKVE